MQQLGLNFTDPKRKAAAIDQARARRNRGKAIAAANHAQDLDTARRLALGLLVMRGPSTISDVRAFAREKGIELPWHLPWSGNVFQHEWFEPTGRRLVAFHRESNARKVNEYRLSPLGQVAAREKVT